MSKPNVPHPTPPIEVAKPTFLGFLWAGTAVSLCFLTFRLVVKFRSFHKFYTDDYLAAFAWVTLLGSSILWQVQAPALYEQYAVTSGEVIPTPGFFERDAEFLRCLVPLTILFYTCLWSVKLSFLMFFRTLGTNLGGQKYWWWFVLIITVLSWGACIGDINYRCLINSIEHILAYCGTLKATKWNNRTFYGNCAADVITDCLIISIPFLMLWNARLPLRTKAILLAIFSLTVFIMIVAVIRVTVVNSPNLPADVSWLYFWSNIEMTTSIIIACMASFRQFFVHATKQRKQKKPSNPLSRKTLLSWLRIRHKSTDATAPLAGGDANKWDSQSHIVPLDSIHVGYNISVTASNFKMEGH